MATIVTASTSVVLVNSSNQPIPTVYFPAISTLGRLVTVRDSDGFVSTGNYIYLQGCNGVTFGDGLSTLSITQPYGFLTLNATSQNNYSIVNTFAFPLGSTAAYVSNVTASTLFVTNTIYSRDLATFSTNTITTSNEELCFNGIPTGTVTPAQLTSTTIAVEAYASNLLFINVRRLVAIGVTSSNLAGCNNPVGTIIYSDNNTPFDLSDGGTGGFSNGGIDVYYGAGLWIAAGDNRGSTPTGCNTGFLQWSLDGKYWVNSVSPNLNADRLRNRVYWANNRYHAVGYNIATGTSGGPYTIMHSGNGKSWVPSLGTPFQGPTSTLNYATGVDFGRGVWVASGLQEANITGSSLLWSPDGSNWNQANSTDWFNTPDAKAYDVAYNAGNFIAIVNNDTPTTNLAISTDGSNWATAGITNGGLNNEPGYLGYSPDQWIVVTQNYHKFSVDDGYTWNTIQDFPTGYPFRPYYDGATWWVSVSTNSTAQSIYYSFNGSNQWSNWLTGGGFENGGYAKSFYSIFSQSNLNLQLLSSMQGISINFATSNLSACNINANNISANAITLGTDSITTRTNFQVACIETSNATKSLFWSDDGLAYNQALSGGFNNGANGVAYNGTNLWVAVGSYSNPLTGPNNPLSSIQWSTNGKNWNAAASGGFSWAGSTICEGLDVAYANGYWVAVGCNDDFSRTILRSLDGSNWSAVGVNTKFSSIGYSIASGTNSLGQFMWVAVGQGASQTNTVQYSVDNGASWSSAASGGFSSLTARAVTYGYGSGNLPSAGRWIAVGVPSSIPGTDGIQYSDNGSNWLPTGSQTYMNHLSVEWNPFLSQYVATGGFNAAAGGTLNRQSTLVTSVNGITWNSAQTGGFRAVAGQLGGTSVTFSDSNWLASGVSTNGVAVILSSTDGSNWAPAASPPVNTSTINQLTNGITTTTQVIGKVFISAGTILANTINMNNGLITNVCSIRFTKIDIAGTSNTAVSLGTNAGRLNQSQDAIAIGTSAGFSNQQPNSIAIGNFSGQYNQNGIAIGQNAAMVNQLVGSIALGSNAGMSNQSFNSVAIGANAGMSNQLNNSVAIGIEAASYGQRDSAIAIGRGAGLRNQGAAGVAIGDSAGTSNQGFYAVSIGGLSGIFNQAPNTVAIGRSAGNSNQREYAVALGFRAGTFSQDLYACSMGFLAGDSNQGTAAVALGVASGVNNQGPGGIGLGQHSGANFQGSNAIAIGGFAGNVQQSTNSIAIGYFTATYYQDSNAVALGTYAGFSNQGRNSIAIGYMAGSNITSSNSIILNATGSALNSSNPSAFYVMPVRSNVTSNSVFYNTTSGEVTYGTIGTIPSISTSSISTGSIFADYISVNSITVFGPSTLTVLGTTFLSSATIGTLSTNILYVNTLSTNSIQASLSSNVTSNIAYYNTTTNQLSYGTASGGGVSDRFSTLFTSSFVASTITLAAGRILSATNSLAIGNGAGASQQAFAIAIGSSAGIGTQNQNAIAIGNSAGFSGQGEASIAIGRNTASGGQASNSIAFGDSAGNNQSTGCIAIGFYAGNQNQLANSIAIGYEAGTTTQSSFSIAIGYQAGHQYQQRGSVSLGSNAGYTTQGSNCVAIGTSAGANVQQAYSVAIGYLAGSNNQGEENVAIGSQSGLSSQGGGAIGIGKSAGQNSQGTDAIAIGKAAGNTSQGSNSVAIGFNTAGTNQGIYCVAVGDSAGGNYQSNYSIAIGAYAGQTNQHTNSIVLNASGSALNTSVTSAFYVNPIRNVAGDVNLQWNTTSFEVSYQSSDSNVKREIETARNYLDDLCKLRPVTFKYISSMEGIPEKKYLGFIAQEVQEIFPSMVFEYQSTLILNDNAIPTMLVTAVQSLQSTNQGLQSRLDRQEQLLQALYSTLNINP